MSEPAEITAETIYLAYPKKVKKPQAIKAIEKAMENHSPAYLLEKTERLAEHATADPMADIPNPAPWFNQEDFITFAPDIVDPFGSPFDPVTTESPADSTPCPRGNPSLGMKDPAVIRWNQTHRPAEMSTIYGSWDWKTFLASHP